MLTTSNVKVIPGNNNDNTLDSPLPPLHSKENHYHGEEKCEHYHQHFGAAENVKNQMQTPSIVRDCCDHSEFEQEGYDIFWQTIENGLYVNKFPLKRYQTNLPTEGKHDAEKNITAVAVWQQQHSQDGTDEMGHPVLYTGSDDKNVCIWDVYKTEYKGCIKCPDRVTALAVYQPNKLIVCGGNDSQAFAFICDTDGENPKTLFGLEDQFHDKHISSIIIHQPKKAITNEDGEPVIIIASFDKTVSLWDLTSATPLYKFFSGHTDSLLSIAVCDLCQGLEGLHIISGSWDKTILFFTLYSENQIDLALYNSNKQENKNEATQDKSENKTDDLALYNSNKQENKNEATQDKCFVVKQAMSLAQRELVNKACNASHKYYYRLKGHTKSVTAICTYNLQGRSDCTSSSSSSLPAYRQQIRKPAAVSSSMPSTNRQQCTVLVTGSLDKTVIIWDVETKEKVRTLKGHDGKITSVLVYESNTGSPPIVISSSEDCKTILWDLLSGEIIRELTFPDKVLSQTIVQNHYGLVLVSGSCKGKAILSNLCRTERIRKYFTKAVTAIATYTPRPTDSIQEPIVLIGDIDAKFTKFNINSHERVHSICHHKSRINAAVIYTPPNPNDDPLVISCDGEAVICIWNLSTTALVKKMGKKSNRNGHQGEQKSNADSKGDGMNKQASDIDHEGAIFCVGLYEPHKCKDVRSFTNERKAGDLDLTKPILITAGTDKKLIFWDILEPNETLHRLAVIVPSTDKDSTTGKTKKDLKNQTHTEYIRSLVVHHPVQTGKQPFFVTGSYDKTATVWNLKTKIRLYSLSLHKDYVFFIALYDPIAHFGGSTPLESVGEGVDEEIMKGHKREGVDEEMMKDPVLVTSSYDFTLGIWALGPHEGHLKHHLKSENHEREYSGHRDSVTALCIYVPKSKEENPLIISGSIDRMVIVWDLFLGIPIQKLIGHTDRVCYITTYIPADGKNPLVFSGSDDETTIVWEDSLHQKPFMPLRDDVNRCFDSDCLEEDWPIITSLAQQYTSKLFLMNSNLFFLAVKFNRPDFLLKFRCYLTLVLPLLKCYEGQNLLTYAVNRNDLISVRILLLCWTENLNTDIHDMLTQRMYHPCYFFPDEDLLLLAKKYPLEFKNFIISLRLIRNHYTLLLNKEDTTIESTFQKQFIDHHSQKAKPYHVTSAAHTNTFHNNHNRNDNHQNNRVTNKNSSSKNAKAERTPDTVPALTSAVVTARHSTNISAINSSNNLSIFKSQTSQLENLINYLDSENMETMKYFSLNKLTYTRVLRLHPQYRSEVEATSNPVAKFDELWYQKLIAHSYYQYFSRIWTEFVYESSDPQPVTSLMIPLRNSANLKESLELYVKVSEQLNSVDIFNSDVGITSLRYFWDSHAKRFHVIAFLKYVVFLLLFITAIYVYEFYYLPNKFNAAERLLMHILNGVVLFIFCYYGYEEYQQFSFEYLRAIEKNKLSFSFNLSYFVTNRVIDTASAAAVAVPISPFIIPGSNSSSSSASVKQTTSSTLPQQQQHHRHTLIRGFLEHFLLDLWNLVDIAIVICGATGMIMRFINNTDLTVGRCFLAIGSILMWFKLLYFMRPFSNSGPLVTMIITIAYSIRWYLLVLFCVLAGFTQGFWLLANNSPNDDDKTYFHTVHSAFLDAFFFMLGQNVPSQFPEAASSELITLLMVLFMMTMIILMLNLLIALMGDVFAKVRAEGFAVWRKEQASIIIEEAFFFTKKSTDEIPPFLHVLKYTSEVGNPDNDENISYQESPLVKQVEQCTSNVITFTPFKEDDDDYTEDAMYDTKIRHNASHGRRDENKRDGSAEKSSHSSNNSNKPTRRHSTMNASTSSEKAEESISHLRNKS